MISELRPDGNGIMFEAEVTSKDKVLARAFLASCKDLCQIRNPWIDGNIELHWRDLPFGQTQVIYPGKPGYIGVVQPVLINSKIPNLLVCTGAEDDTPGGYTLKGFVIEPMSIYKQKGLKLSVRVEFFNIRDEFIRSEYRTFTVVPSNSVMLYSVRPRNLFTRIANWFRGPVKFNEPWKLTTVQLENSNGCKTS